MVMSEVYEVKIGVGSLGPIELVSPCHGSARVRKSRNKAASTFSRRESFSVGKQ